MGGDNCVDVAIWRSWGSNDDRARAIFGAFYGPFCLLVTPQETVAEGSFRLSAVL